MYDGLRMDDRAYMLREGSSTLIKHPGPGRGPEVIYKIRALEWVGGWV